MASVQKTLTNCCPSHFLSTHFLVVLGFLSSDVHSIFLALSNFLLWHALPSSVSVCPTRLLGCRLLLTNSLSFSRGSGWRNRVPMKHYISSSAKNRCKWFRLRALLAHSSTYIDEPFYSKASSLSHRQDIRAHLEPMTLPGICYRKN